jgi:hypothetical protein
MKKISIAATFAAALGCAATLFGQTAGAGTQAAAQTPGSDAHRTVTVVGCVQRAGGTGAVGTSGVAAGGAAGAGSANGWILANASSGAPVMTTAGSASAPNSAATDANTAAGANREAGITASGAAPVPAGAGGGANRGMSGSTYMLEGKQDLSAHAGHKVEITGTLDGMANSGAAASTATATGRAESATSQTGASAAASMPAGQRLQVSSVKMISPNCS